MRKALISFALLAVLTVSCQAADSRLAQEITYQGGYKRLHSVAEDLTKQTGVTIRAGDNKQDWHVRDIPLVVFVKDMPLGKLLQTIADCAHVKLTADKVTNATNDQPAYRLYRDKTKEDDITLHVDARVEAHRKTAAWAWDTLVKYASMPDASADVPPITPIDPNAMKSTIKEEVDGEQIRLVAKALASLGPDAKTKAMAGEQVTVRIGSSGPLNELYDYIFKHPCWPMRGQPATPTEADRQSALLAIKVHRQDRPDTGAGFSMYVNSIPMEADIDGQQARFHEIWEAKPVLCAKTLADVKKLKLPAAPDSEAVWHDTPPPGFKALKEEADYALPLLKSNVKITASQAGLVTRMEALRAVSETAGINIIYEEFHSQKLRHNTYVRDRGAEVPVSQILKGMGKGSSGFDWLIDDKAGVLIGWAREWRKSHQSLVSENLRESMIAKCEQGGAELDDFVPMWDLTRNQVTEWFALTPQFFGISTDGPLASWRLYSRLSSEDKVLAHSEAGLPLAKFDPGQLLEHFQKCKEERYGGLVVLAMPDSPRSIAENKYLSIDSIGKLVLRVESIELLHWYILPLSPDGTLGHEDYTPPPDGPKKHRWTIELTDPAAPDIKTYLGGEWDVAFPVFTPAREAELRKKAEVKAAEKKVSEPLKH